MVVGSADLGGILASAHSWKSVTLEETGEGIVRIHDVTIIFDYSDALGESIKHLQPSIKAPIIRFLAHEILLG